MHRKFLPTFALMLGLLWVAAVQAGGYKAEYRLSTVLGPAFSWGKAGERWAELVRQKTDGRIKIRVYPGASLVGGDQTREFASLRDGIIDLAIGSSINWSPQVKQLNLFSLPFLIPDDKALDAVLKGEVGREIFSLLEQQGVVPLAFGENGFRELSNSRQAVKAPGDLKGMKIRVVGSPIFVDAFAALGATPVQIGWADAQSALVTKAVDGQENPVPVFNAAKLYSLGQNHLTLWGYMTDPLIFVVNKQVWAGWSDFDRQAVREAAEQAAAENLMLARRGLPPGEASLLRELEKQGVVVTRLTPEQRLAFKAATRTVFDKWSAAVGKALVRKAEAAVAGAR